MVYWTMDDTNGATCGFPISMQDVRDRVSKPQFNGGQKRGVSFVLGGTWEEMKWQRVVSFRFGNYRGCGEVGEVG